ncbi:Uncharacterised protein [[Clostridium] sordellii]|uniref:hypothetical protein n=1 Tax=Paraclostridium sordellii TaxID=1505 RepID=UPI0005E6EAA6|nr:hypothetical protein [Paeniclostridium sordellii]MCH1965619.1 hypothetical protein [Paeniclostridium sordellii]MDU2146641.1 hypothetical protein [Paeniclostridium sordellii]MDU6483659.1 hypothetical protein [Paeniclostridium sordellii]CEN82017.1 Uncharacterised protein [[Clostridium] sordellii] [Paeniclostridium sordellii]CEN83249.1 Uncharacterised protein [[Clostridium] sordellii] [Paeniclostridium sordellii]
MISIRIKRCFFSIVLICAIVISLVNKSHKGFQISTAIICAPLFLLFLLRLILPEIKIFDDISKEYSLLSPIEKVGSLVNLILIGIWVLGQIYCLM